MEPVILAGRSKTTLPRSYWSEIESLVSKTATTLPSQFVLIHYLGEYRITERELAHGASA